MLETISVLWCILCISEAVLVSETAMYGAITKETIDINLIKIFIDGPDVSLNGSPTVSPVTEALCGSDFL